MPDPERTTQVSSVATLSADEAAAVLERLADGVRAGRLHLTVANGDVRLRPTRSIRTELRVRAAGPSLGGRIDLDLSWTRLNEGG